MRAADPKALEQLKRGNDAPYLEHLQKELEHAHTDLRTVQGDSSIDVRIALGRIQGEAAVLQKILNDFERAGRLP